MKKLIILLALPLLFASCQSGPSEAQQRVDLEAQVMKVHDDAMADMGKIYRLRRNITRLRDTFATQEADTNITRELTQHILLLNKADDAMMNWMRQYSVPAEEQPHDETMQYLQEELQKMERVKQTMDSTIAAAQQTYTQHEQKQ